MEHGTPRHRGNGNRPARLGKETAQPRMDSQPVEIQRYGSLVHYPLGLSEEIRAASVEALNQALADTCVLRDMYKKHHWQASGPTFYQLHLLYDAHYAQQVKLVDLLAERIQTLGGIAVAMAHDVAELTGIERPPRGREEIPTQLSRLLRAHEHVLIESRAAAKRAAEGGDDGTNDLLVSDVIRTNEMQVWFIAEHLVDLPLVRPSEE